MRSTSDLKRRIDHYLALLAEYENRLSINSSDWGKYQKTFNVEVDGIFSTIVHFEQQCIAAKDLNTLTKFQSFFIQKFRQYFLRGYYVPWCLNKPFGYAGDFKIIDQIYLNNPQSTGELVHLSRTVFGKK